MSETVRRDGSTVVSDDEVSARAVGTRLASIYEAIAERSMRGLPVFNTKLRVEAIGFTASSGRAVGILVTPWFMNLVVAALPGGSLSPRPAGASIDHDLPGGVFPCVVGAVDGFGRLDSASLFSPMFEFDDPDVAAAVAEAAIAEILTPVEADPPVAAAADPTPTLDRRALLFGRRSSAEDRSCR